MSEYFEISHQRSVYANESRGESYHQHPYHELLLVTSGDLAALTPRSYLSHHGACFLLYRAGHLHNQINRAGTVYERYYLDFAPDFCAIPPSAQSLFAADAQPDAVLLPLSMRRAQQLAAAARIAQELSESMALPGADERVQLLVGYILSEYARRYAHGAAVSGGAEADYLSEVTMYIGDHLTEKLTIARLAREFHVGHTKLSSDFRNYLSMSVNEYITAERINRARRLLRDGASVDAAAEQCGFSDSGYFIRVFRRYEQVTPLQYKRTGRSKKDPLS